MSREVNLPDTSIAAFKALTPEKLVKDYENIKIALVWLKEANYEQIATFLMWSDINKCSRRLKELEGMQIIYKPGSKSLTKRNRSAYNYKLVTNGQTSVEPEKLMEGKCVADYAKDIIQKTLFD